MGGGSESVDVIPRPGHMVSMEAPEWFNEDVRSFLRGVG
jgi:pimeloyl-ACP methyl ester carboxylesterase